MKNLTLLLIIGLAIVYLNYYFPTAEKIDAPTPVAPPKLTSFLLGGEQLPTDHSSKWSNSMERIGMNTVAISLPAIQRNWHTDELLTEHLQVASIIEKIRLAKVNNLQVILLPKVFLDTKNKVNQSLWHGMIQADSDSLLLSWFAKYERFLLKWAAIAEQEEVAILSIGNELCALTSAHSLEVLPPFLSKKTQQKTSNRTINRSTLLSSNSKYDYWEDADYSGSPKMQKRKKMLNQQWSRLIQKLRKQYSGSLMYTAHFKNYQYINFWSQLDIIGINAHFPLLENGQLENERDVEVLYSQLKASWKGIFDNLSKFKKDFNLENKPIFFSEMSYAFYKNSTLNPWGDKIMWSNGLKREYLNKDKDFKERVLAVNVLREVQAQYKAVALKGLLYHPITIDTVAAANVPFSLQIGNNSEDQLQQELIQFLDKE